MTNDHHDITCNCYDCKPKTALNDFVDADPTKPKKIGPPKSAADLIGAKLVAKKDIKVYNNKKDLKVLRTVKPGGTVGTVYSFVTKPDGLLLDGGGLVLLGTPGMFDLEAAINSLQEIENKRAQGIKAATDKRLAENDNPLYQFGKTLETINIFGALKWVGILIVAAVLIGLFVRVSGK